MIYHIINKTRWNQFKTKAFYRSNSLSRDGFIHCSFENQVIKVANTLHHGQVDLCVLCINEKRVQSILKVEDLFKLNEKYPHLYDELPISAVEKVVDLNISDSGDFIKPNLTDISLLAVEEREWT